VRATVVGPFQLVSLGRLAHPVRPVQRGVRFVWWLLLLPVCVVLVLCAGVVFRPV